MSQPYNQFRAMMAITKASLRAQFKSPMALIFGFLFPLFFILIFGSSGSGVPGVSIAMDKNSDTTNQLFFAFKNIPNIKIKQYGKDEKGEAKKNDDLLKGRITAIVNIRPNQKDTLKKYVVHIQSSKATQNTAGLLENIVGGVIANIDKRNNADRSSIGIADNLPPVGERVYKRIDFILPGQLGFSLLSAGLFGLSFLFFNLRETLVLKRFNATPLRRPYIILGEAIARVIFQFFIFSLIIIIGKYAFGFTLVHGFKTYLEMMVICFLGLFVFMGFGFMISGISKNINTIPAVTNIIGFPQFMLSGTFFPYEGLPSFLHPIAKALPLTHINDALRKISFEGLHLGDCMQQIGILSIWGIVIYVIAIKVFRWE